MKNGLIIGGAVVAGFLGAGLLATFDWLPVDSTQEGFRGTGMVEFVNPRAEAKLIEANQPPVSFGEAVPGGAPANQVYENVQVLGDLTEDEFNALMLAITEWVSPEQGCNYCHNPENLAADDLYTKVVARRMIQMTRTINSQWQDHVKATGVNCYTCHRGNPVPQYVWFKEDGGPQAGGFTADRTNQNLARPVRGDQSLHTAFTSLPYNALDTLLNEDGPIRVIAANALPMVGQQGASIQDTERTYSLMMHMSESLNVNCTYCHNSRAFSVWEEGSARRVTAWYGIRMVREVNQTYITSLDGVYQQAKADAAAGNAPLIAENVPDFPAGRFGPQGDIPKVACFTCHQGVGKPLYGASMLTDHPKLGVAGE